MCHSKDSCADSLLQEGRKVQIGHRHADKNIFVKLLFDKEFIYIAVTGNSPMNGEKFFISIPDLNNADRPLKKYTLDRKAPFAVARKTYPYWVCYELKIPKKLAGLTDSQAAFFLNVTRQQADRQTAVLFRKKYGGITLGSSVLRNGNFFLQKKPRKYSANLIGKTFPEYWGFAGSRCTSAHGSLQLDGVLYQYLTIDSSNTAQTLKITVNCTSVNGKQGFIQPYLSLCRRPAGDRRAFSHDYKKNAAGQTVNGKKFCSFSFELDPCEKGYIYLRGSNVIIENAAAACTPKQSAN